jgi:hypothetical protein
MCPWLILASVRKVEILRHEKSAVGLSRTPHDRTLLITQAQGMSASVTHRRKCSTSARTEGGGTALVGG